MTTRHHSSESVTEGHPDKIADQISDAVLDELLSKDPESRVACETFVTTGLALVGGEISTDSYVDLQRVIRDTIKEIGYDNPELGFFYRNVAVLNMIHEQSPDIAQGVVAEDASEQGAGDQGLMFGYATNETEELMPQPIVLAHKLVRKLSSLRRSNELSYLRPDGKSQVSVRYEDEKPVAVEKVTIAAQHDDDVDLETIRSDIKKHAIIPVLGDLYTEDIEIIVNGTGKFVIGGPHGDSGLTGRKIIVDTYGGVGSHGGGCFSGKDPSKVDRSGTYAARYIAKNVVAADLAEECEVQIAYSIGVPEPFSFDLTTNGTGILPDDEITEKVFENFDLRPGKIIERFDLKRPIYKQSAAFGHVGRTDIDLPWEKTDLF